MSGKVQDSIEKVSTVFASMEQWLMFDTRLPDGHAEGEFSTPQSSEILIRNENAIVNAIQIHNLPVPAWVPASYMRSQKRNLYLKMLNPASVGGKGTLAFFKESKSDWKSKLAGIGSSVLTAVTNQVGAVCNTAQGLVGSVMDTLGLSDDETTSSVADPFLENQPYVKVYGIKPTPDLAQNLEIIRQAWNIIKNVLNTDNGFKKYVDNMKTALMKAITEYLQPSGGTKINGFDDLWKVLSDNNSREHSLLERLMINSVPGKYMQFSMLPCVSNIVGFESCEGSWQGGFTGESQGMGNSLAKLTGLSVGSVEKLEWSATNLMRTSPITVSFSMYNDTYQHFKRNFYFILGFTAGAKATTDVIFVCPPYLYDVEIPGGGRYRFCKCRCTFTPVGKMRKMTDTMKAEFIKSSPWGSGNFSKIDIYIPDAWEANIEFTSVLPDTWNFLSSYYFGTADNAPKLGDTVDNLLGHFAKSFATELNNIEAADKAEAAKKEQEKSK